MSQTENIRGNQKMTSVALCSEQPILTAGIEAVLAGLEDCTLSGVFADLDLLVEHVRTLGPSVVLIEVTAAITFAALSRLKSIAADVPVVLWVDEARAEFVFEALAMGVRGILRKNLPIELQIKCLRVCAAGELWVEQSLCEHLLVAKRVKLTRRERQLVSLLAQGLKNKEIAYAQRLSEGTVKVYLSRLFKKVGVTDRFELALFAIQNRLVGAACEPEPARAAVEGRPQAPPLTGFYLPSFVQADRPAEVLR
jgi:two-component system, NarL family, nitrate/nitrite response regulator NarL